MPRDLYKKIFPSSFQVKNLWKSYKNMRLCWECWSLEKWNIFHHVYKTFLGPQKNDSSLSWLVYKSNNYGLWYL